MRKLNTIYEFSEKLLKRDARIINGGELPDIVYLNKAPLYLQKGKSYSWDKLGERLLGEYNALDTVNLFHVSLDPPNQERKHEN